MASRYIYTTGTVISITYPGYGEVPVVRVNVQTPSAVFVLVFQSRTSLEAIDIGHVLTVEGTVVMSNGVPCIFNPHYTIESGT